VNIDDETERLGAALSQLAAALLQDGELTDDLERLARLAAQLIEHSSGVSIAMLVEGEPQTEAVTDQVALELDLVQYETGDGPCLLALGGSVVRVGYVPTDERFPHFAVGAADRRVLSVLSIPILDHGEVLGTMNLYARERDAFDDHDNDVGRIIAAEVAAAILTSSVRAAAAATRDELQQHHDESVVVSRAMGALMALQQCTAEQALLLITSAAETNGERLITTAERILASMGSPAGPT
jgi:GAF domain-containing protein